MKFYKCDVCGKIIVMLKKTPVPTICCGKEMKELIPGAVDGAHEKHIPVVKQDGKEIPINVGTGIQPVIVPVVKEHDDRIAVNVGEVDHPMTDKHYIEFIILETNEGWEQKTLKPGDDPSAIFAIKNSEQVIAAYAYCNLHGLWKKEV